MRRSGFVAEPQGSSPSGRPPPVSPGFLLIALGRIARERVDVGLRPQGLSLRHLSALGHLSRQPGLSYSELGRRAGITAQSMQATLRQLEQLGAVERRTSPGRGRTAELHISKAGGRLLQQGQQVILDVEGELLADLTVEDREALGSLLMRAFANAIGP